MRKRIEELVCGDLLELEDPDCTARVVAVSKRDLLPRIFQHYAGSHARTVDMVRVDDPSQKFAVQHHKDDVVETIEREG